MHNICRTIFRALWILVLLLLFFSYQSAFCETLYVCIDSGELNGRAAPNRHAQVEMRLQNGETVESLSVSGGWVEILGGETGSVWCKAEYLSSTQESRFYRNNSGGRVFVRDSIQGKKTGSVSANKVVSITRTINGWGFTGSGWVDLSFFKEKSNQED